MNLMPLYSFSTDYVSEFAPNWARHLEHVQGTAGIRMLEVGSFEGRSAIWFLENILTGPGSNITCVDGFWTPYGEVFDRNIAASGKADRVIKKKGRSTDILPGLDNGSFDVIYIDAGHTEQEVWDDAVQCWRLSKAGSVIIFDDYEWGPELPMEQRPKRAITRFLLQHAGQFQVLHTGYQLIVKRN